MLLLVSMQYTNLNTYYYVKDSLAIPFISLYASYQDPLTILPLPVSLPIPLLFGHVSQSCICVHGLLILLTFLYNSSFLLSLFAFSSFQVVLPLVTVLLFALCLKRLPVMRMLTQMCLSTTLLLFGSVLLNRLNAVYIIAMMV